MLFFLSTFRADPFEAGALTAEGEPIRLSRTLEAAQRAAGDDGRVLVLDAARVPLSAPLTAEAPPTTHRIDPAAVLNRAPYRPPHPVEASGGVVVRSTSSRTPPPTGAPKQGTVEVLLIFRRGAWDLPKGKLEDGEGIEDCAVREVAEEVGIPERSLRVTKRLPDTLHGYARPKHDAYAVKTTHWFAMTTSASAFIPQTDEDIEAVEWVLWNEAGRRLGYENLRRLHAALEPRDLGV